MDIRNQKSSGTFIGLLLNNVIKQYYLVADNQSFMGFSFNRPGQKDVHFITCTVVQWIDVFTRSVYTDIIVARLKYYQQNKTLNIYGWVIMSNSLHLICSCKKGTDLNDVLREFKEHTSSAVVTALQNNEGEQRKTWMLWLLKQMTGNIALWQPANDIEEIRTKEEFLQKLDFIHFSPVKAGWVDNPADYRYSSARDMTGGKGLIELTSYE